MAGVVLAAGRGRRLAPLTDFRPKALCPVNNVPLVDTAIDRARNVTPDIAVNVHHRLDLMEPHLAGRVYLSIEAERPLGTAGALGALREWIDGRDVLVLNADAWHLASLDGLLAEWHGDRIRLFTVSANGPSDFGSRRYCGACVMPWRVVSGLSSEPSSLYEVCWRPAWEEGTLELAEAPGPFFDCGTPRSYLEANLTASGGLSVVGPGAAVDGEVIRSVVWEGGHVARGERLFEAIRIGSDVTVQTRSGPA